MSKFYLKQNDFIYFPSKGRDLYRLGNDLYGWQVFCSYKNILKQVIQNPTALQWMTCKLKIGLYITIKEKDMFKAGDKVYYPLLGVKVFTLEESDTWLGVWDNNNFYGHLNPNTGAYKNDSLSCIYPATYYYQGLLEKLNKRKYQAPLPKVDNTFINVAKELKVNCVRATRKGQENAYIFRDNRGTLRITYVSPIGDSCNLYSPSLEDILA